MRFWPRKAEEPKPSNPKSPCSYEVVFRKYSKTGQVTVTSKVYRGEEHLSIDMSGALSVHREGEETDVVFTYAPSTWIIIERIDEPLER